MDLAQFLFQSFLCLFYLLYLVYLLYIVHPLKQVLLCLLYQRLEFHIILQNSLLSLSASPQIKFLSEDIWVLSHIQPVFLAEKVIQGIGRVVTKSQANRAKLLLTSPMLTFNRRNPLNISTLLPIQKDRLH